MKWNKRLCGRRTPHRKTWCVAGRVVTAVVVQSVVQWGYNKLQSSSAPSLIWCKGEWAGPAGKPHLAEWRHHGLQVDPFKKPCRLFHLEESSSCINSKIIFLFKHAVCNSCYKVSLKLRRQWGIMGVVVFVVKTPPLLTASEKYIDKKAITRTWVGKESPTIIELTEYFKKLKKICWKIMIYSILFIYFVWRIVSFPPAPGPTAWTLSYTWHFIVTVTCLLSYWLSAFFFLIFDRLFVMKQKSQ